MSTTSAAERALWRSLPLPSELRTVPAWVEYALTKNLTFGRQVDALDLLCALVNAREVTESERAMLMVFLARASLYADEMQAEIDAEDEIQAYGDAASDAAKELMGDAPPVEDS